MGSAANNPNSTQTTFAKISYAWGYHLLEIYRDLPCERGTSLLCWGGVRRQTCMYAIRTPKDVELTDAFPRGREGDISVFRSLVGDATANVPCTSCLLCWDVFWQIYQASIRQGWSIRVIVSQESKAKPVCSKSFN